MTNLKRKHERIKNLKGRLLNDCHHSFVWLNKKERAEAIEYNNFRDQHLALVRCKHCGNYQFTT